MLEELIEILEDFPEWEIHTCTGNCLWCRLHDFVEKHDPAGLLTTDAPDATVGDSGSVSKHSTDETSGQEVMTGKEFLAKMERIIENNEKARSKNTDKKKGGLE
jgi:hypothetical protein